MIKTSIKILINTDPANNIVPPQRKSRRKNIDFIELMLSLEILYYYPL